jgi:hypothetical protein
LAEVAIGLNFEQLAQLPKLRKRIKGGLTSPRHSAVTDRPPGIWHRPKRLVVLKNNLVSDETEHADINVLVPKIHFPKFKLL